MTTNHNDPTEHGGPDAMMRDMVKNPGKYGPLRPLPERGKGSETRIAGRGDDMAELYKKLGFSMPIAKTAEMAGKYGGHLRDGHVTELDEKAAVLDALSIHRMVITSECLQRKKRYDVEEAEARRWLSQIAADRRPNSFHFDPYTLTNNDAEQSILEDYLGSLEDDQATLNETYGGPVEETGEQDTPVIPQQRGRGRPRKEQEARHSTVPTVEELIHKWGASDAYMFQVLLDEERHGIDYAEQHYDTYERVEKIQRNVEFMAALLPPQENAYFWCRVRQMGIIRERSYDIAMGFPIADFSDVLDQITAGADIHDIAHLLDWSFQNAYGRVMGSMLDGQEHRMMVVSMLAQQIPLSPQLMQMMGGGPPPAYWQGQGFGQPGQGPEGEEQVPDKRGAIFSFFNKKGGPPTGAQPQQGSPPNNNRRRRRGND